MNSVQLIGRLTRDPEVRYSQNNMAIATFSIAIDRPPRQDGTKETDFPRITVFGRQAENCERYLVKGRLVGIEGRIQTGSYTNRNGDKVYTTDVVANRVEFLEWGDRQNQGGGSFGQNRDRNYGGGQNDFGGGQQDFGRQNDFGGQKDFGGQNQGGGFSQNNSFSENANDGFNESAGSGFSEGSGSFGDDRQDQQSGSIPTGFAPIDDDDIPF